VRINKLFLVCGFFDDVRRRLVTIFDQVPCLHLYVAFILVSSTLTSPPLFTRSPPPTSGHTHLGPRTYAPRYGQQRSEYSLALLLATQFWLGMSCHQKGKPHLRHRHQRARQNGRGGRPRPQAPHISVNRLDRQRSGVSGVTRTSRRTTRPRWYCDAW
jgi:hypothetical protein